MRAEYIRIDPFSFKQILSVRIEKGINSHGTAVVCGYIDEAEGERYVSCPAGSTPVILKAVGEEGEERIFFYGILEEVNLARENAQLLMTVRFTTYTRLMDLTKKARAFQEPSCTYRELLGRLCAGYKGAAFIMSSEYSDVPLRELVVQYQETDWEFLLRLASHFHMTVLADFLTPGVKFYFGLPKRQNGMQVDAAEYRLEKSLTAHQYRQQHGVAGLSEADAMSVVWESRELLEIGDRVLFGDRSYIVGRSLSRLDGHQMTNTYVLFTENGLKVPKVYNGNIIGASIDGVVTDVQGSVVRVKLGIEDGYPSARWYPYATVFSSPDGSGWYCMPQAGDEIRLYFPTRSEKHAYAASAVHRPVEAGAAGEGAEAPRSNPHNNELRSQDGKVVQLLEDRIVLDNGNGLQIAMVDREGITVSSSGNLKISAGGEVCISGKELSLAGSRDVIAMAGNSRIHLTESDVVLSGTNVKVQ